MKNITIKDKSRFADKVIVDKITLWGLRVILNIGGSVSFVDYSKEFSDIDILIFLDLEEYAYIDKDKFSRSDIITLLKQKLSILENTKNFTSLKVLTTNINKLSKLLKLSKYEKMVLEFVILNNEYDILNKFTTLLGDTLNNNQAKHTLSIVLDIPLQEIENMFKSNSSFAKSSILTIDGGNYKLAYKFEFISKRFSNNMFSLDESINHLLKDSIRKVNKANLDIKDYRYIKKDIDIMLSYLKQAIQNKQKGVNILLYGLPGTGKSELTKVISKSLNIKLYEVSYASKAGEALGRKSRTKAYQMAQAVLSSKNKLLMYDEAEDIFDTQHSTSRLLNKAWINRMLETNTLPTIWITNDIYSIDEAVIRRFDLSVELKVPTKKIRKQILKKYAKQIICDDTMDLLSKNKNITPALISTTAKVISTIKTKNHNDTFRYILNNNLKAQGYSKIKKEKSSSSTTYYNPKFINTTTNLTELSQGIKKSKKINLCLYGVPGTGKSAYGKYLGELLNKKILLKKGSDLQSKYVGETERNIAEAFKEAKDSKAVLVFDEVDTFLQDRLNLTSSWEISSVNEMLVQMETFDGIFIATTNLIDNLDKASLRRFDLKLEFNYLTPSQSWDMFVFYCKKLKFSKPSNDLKSSIQRLKSLTPGDQCH